MKKEAPPPMKKEEMSIHFSPLKSIIEKGNPQDIANALVTIKSELSQKYTWHVVLYEIESQLRRLKTQSTQLTQNEITAFLEKLEDWQNRLS
jgi:hypothetical protein